MRTETEKELFRERAAVVLAIRDCWYEEELRALQSRYHEIDQKIAARAHVHVHRAEALA